MTSCQAESPYHPVALFPLNTVSRVGNVPVRGSWITYGLGSLNKNLPGDQRHQKE